jgi:hypothetical protein
MKTAVLRFVWLGLPLLVWAQVARATEGAVAPAPASALYEFGIFGALAWLPDYPGSDQGRSRILILPGARYRGAILRSSEDEGMAARLLARSSVRLNFSLAGSFPADSEKNRARDGMADLDWLGEAGPQFLVLLHREPRQRSVVFEAPIRHMFSTDFGRLRAHGWVFAPGILWREQNVLDKDLETFLEIQASWATEGVHSYFYHVSAADARADRPEHLARAGYLGANLLGGWIYRTPTNQWFAGFQLSSHHGAANQNSALHRSDWGVAFYVGAGRWLFESDARGVD